MGGKNSLFCPVLLLVATLEQKEKQLGRLCDVGANISTLVRILTVKCS